MQDLNLEKGLINIRCIGNSIDRTLPLKTSQVMLFYKYIYEVRPKLIARSKQETDHFIINMRGLPEKGFGAKSILKNFKSYFPNRKLNSVTLRQSVITNLIKEGTDIRIVQKFAGHITLTTTEKYRENGLNELQNIIQKYHPLQ
jgi:integrase/recombinase XerD